jgi:hypothetical protein
MAKKVILTKLKLGGNAFSKDGGQRWAAQVDGKFVKWKQLIDDDEILALREAILDLHKHFGFDAEIEVRAFVDPQTGYKDIPVHLYIESYGNVTNLRQEILEYREDQAKKELKQKIVKVKAEFPFLMFGEDE